MSKLLGVFWKGDPACKLVGLALEKLRRYGAAIDMQVLPCPISKLPLLDAAKRADAIIVGASDIAKSTCDALKKELDLHTSIRSDGKFTLISNALGGIYGGKSGYCSDKTFGRAAYDAEYISELEIERTARIAYEYAEERGMRLLLLDVAPLVTSCLWRKIVSDINEDYPSVPVTMLDAREFLNDFASRKNGYEKSDVAILCGAFAGDLVWAAIAKSGYEMLCGASSLALLAPLCSGADILLALPNLLRHCFALDEQANILEKCLSSLDPSSTVDDFTRALNCL